MAKGTWYGLLVALKVSPENRAFIVDNVDIVDILMIIDIVLVCVQLYRADSSGSVWERVYYCGYEPSFNILCVGIDI